MRGGREGGITYWYNRRVLKNDARFRGIVWGCLKSRLDSCKRFSRLCPNSKNQYLPMLLRRWYIDQWPTRQTLHSISSSSSERERGETRLTVKQDCCKVVTGLYIPSSIAFWAFFFVGLGFDLTALGKLALSSIDSAVQAPHNIPEPFGLLAVYYNPLFLH